MDNQQSFRDLVVMGFEQLNSELTELRRGQAIIERESREGIAQLRVTVAKLETKMAIYSAIGAVVGSAAMSWVLKTLEH